MKKLFVVFTLFSALLSISFLNLRSRKPYAGNFPGYNANYPPPEGYTNPFELSQNYPDSYDQNERYPWQKIDFKRRPESYLNAVLNYCLEGNTEVDFRVQKNPIRKWYHAPWLHDDSKYNAAGKYIGNGREYIHGLTRERFTPVHEIHALQDVELENWAIGFYNVPGGYVLNKVWRSGNAPHPELSEFPEGTVSFKLLFTDATLDKVPFLRGTLEWTANIYPCNPLRAGCVITNRVNRTVRLLQIDVAVKDKRAEGTGWVFGTFIYNGAHGGNSIWKRMVPVGLSWGDDPQVADQIHVKGAYINHKLLHTYINKNLLETGAPRTSPVQAYMHHLGLGGRLNGPVDNPVSSCVSCHARAAVDEKGNPALSGKLLDTSKFTLAEFQENFRTIPGGTRAMMQNKVAYHQTDYSLQVTIGIRNYYLHQNWIASGGKK